MTTRTRAWHILLAETWNKWQADRANGAAAGLAYYTVFSIVPMVVVITAAAGAIFGTTDVRDAAAGLINSTVGPGTGSFIVGVLQATSDHRNLLAGVIYAVLAIYGSLGIFGQLKATLDRMWGASGKFRWSRYFREDLWLFILVLASGFMLAVSAIGSIIVARLFGELAGTGALVRLTLSLADSVLALAVTSILVLLIYHFLPAVHFRFRDLTLGALLTALLLTLGRLVLTLYLQFTDLANVYGAAGAVMLLLVWVYYSAQIFYFGAEFTYIYAKRRRIGT